MDDIMCVVLTSKCGVFGDGFALFIDHPLCVAMISSYHHHITTRLTCLLYLTDGLVYIEREHKVVELVVTTVI